MTAREYAEQCGVEIIGKLQRKSSAREVFDPLKGKMVTERHTYYEDEAGTQINGSKASGWCLVTAAGEAY